MTKLWIESDINDKNSTIPNVIINSTENSTIIKTNETNSLFWTDEIKKYYNNPSKRLEIAFLNLPLPHAFKEAAIAIRAIIKLKKNNSEIFEKELKKLYELACVYSFSLDYSEKLDGPGFNIMGTVPGKYLFSLPMDYSQLGYEKLTLLTKTDIKMIKDSWGEPQKHQTMNTLYFDIWSSYEQKLVDERKKSKDEFQNYLKDLVQTHNANKQ